MIEVLETPPLNTIQDQGRFGFRRYGIGSAGAMDRLALAAGNCALGNAPDLAGVELQLFPVSLAFRKAAVIAITGADCAATIDGNPVLPWWVTSIAEGQVLRLEAPRNGARAYLCAAGGIDVSKVLGSRSTQIRDGFGGMCGRALCVGDVIPAGLCSPVRFRDPFGFGIEPPDIALGAVWHDWAKEDDVVVRFVPASEQKQFDRESLRAFETAAWTITPQSNRMGYRLSGPALNRNENTEMRSQGILQGVVQAPPSGQPIVQLADGNSAGGYPKLAYVIQADLWRLAQAEPGRELRFLQVSLDEARHARAEQLQYLNDVSRLSGHCRLQVCR